MDRVDQNSDNLTYLYKFTGNNLKLYYYYTIILSYIIKHKYLNPCCIKINTDRWYNNFTSFRMFEPILHTPS